MRVKYTGPAAMRANELFQARLDITLQESLRPGGRITVAARHFSDFGDAQISDPEAENYLTISTLRPGISWELATGIPWYRHPWNRGFDVLLKQGQLDPGDCITLLLGGEAGFRGQSFVENPFRLRIGVQSQADAPWVITAETDSPSWPITGGEPVALRVHVPDPTSQRPSKSVCLKLEDAYGNPTAYATEVLLLLDDKRPLQTVSIDQGMMEVPDVLLPADGTWHRITAISCDGRFFARSNPFGVSPLPDYHLFWGEIHAQSGLCDGTSSPADLYRYARQAAGLDFASVTSHDFEMTPEDWAQVMLETQEANRPGIFVTLLGYEWSGPTARGGDHNVYYLADEGPLLYNGRGPWVDDWEPAGRYATVTRSIADVIAECAGRATMVIPHCGGRIANLDFYDPAVMPVLEIHSCHRNWEHVAHEALRRGYKIGFIGGSDDHRGAIGDAVPAARERFFSTRSGLVAIYARELTRESLWEAFFARRVYATNGGRPVVTFSANGLPMGSEIVVGAGATVQLEFTVQTDDYFDHVEVFRQDQVIARFQGTTNQIMSFCGKHLVCAEPGTTAYYIKIFQANGGIAWSSPVWITGQAN